MTPVGKSQDITCSWKGAEASKAASRVSIRRSASRHLRRTQGRSANRRDTSARSSRSRPVGSSTTVSRRKLPARWYEESTSSAEASSPHGSRLTSSNASRNRSLPGLAGGAGSAVTTTMSTSE